MIPRDHIREFISVGCVNYNVNVPLGCVTYNVNVPLGCVKYNVNAPPLTDDSSRARNTISEECAKSPRGCSNITLEHQYSAVAFYMFLNTTYCKTRIIQGCYSRRNKCTRVQVAFSERINLQRL
jgi:hypothetical protein